MLLKSLADKIGTRSASSDEGQRAFLESLFVNPEPVCVPAGRNANRQAMWGWLENTYPQTYKAFSDIKAVCPQLFDRSLRYETGHMLFSLTNGPSEECEGTDPRRSVFVAVNNRGHLFSACAKAVGDSKTVDSVVAKELYVYAHHLGWIAVEYSNPTLSGKSLPALVSGPRPPMTYVLGISHPSAIA